MKTQIGISLILGILLLSGFSTLVSGLIVKDISISPATVEPGKRVSVSIELKNDLDDSVENVGVSLKLDLVPFAPETSSDSVIDKIKSDKSSTFNIGLIANPDAEAGVYKIPIVISYRVPNQTVPVTQTSTISLTVNAKPKLDLSAEGFLLAGKSQLNVKITNSGLAKARFLEVNMNDGNYKILSPNKVYIGDLNSDDFDSFTLEIYSQNPGTIIVPVNLVYKDFANNEYSEARELTMKVYSTQEAINLGLIQKSNTGLYVGLIILVIILWIVYSRVRKWLRNKKKDKGGSKNGRQCRL